MTSAEDLKRGLVAAFQMPSMQTMVSRKSSITNAFVNAVIPTVVPTTDQIEEALRILGMGHGDVRCAYCGDKSTEWDHLRPLVVKRRPTGFITEIANLVPACGKCNQSKGNKPWREWMMSAARLSPTGRGVTGIEQRISRLEKYEQWKTPTQVDFGLIIGAEEWERYWSLCEAVNEEMRRAQEVADALRARIVEATSKRSSES
jgi:HNH endonuclease